MTKTSSRDPDAATLVRWPHRAGGQAHCLARLLAPIDDRPPVVVLSELASNPDATPIVTDVAGAVRASRTILPPAASSSATVWLLHHGRFSYADPAPGETFTLVDPTWTGALEPAGDPQTFDLLDPDRVAGLVGDVTLPPPHRIEATIS